MKDLEEIAMPYKGLSGLEIEKKSFEIIRSEMGEIAFADHHIPVVVRVIHATADFDFSRNLVFHPDAVEAGLAAIRRGRPILTDVNMVASGINKSLCKNFGIEVLTPIGSVQCSELASERGCTRAAAAMELGIKQGDVGIVAIGNAPTALIHLLELIDKGAVRPDLVIGVPVGFVNAVESKEMLASQEMVPFITSKGRKGGSPVAAAILNAILKMAVNS